MNSQNGWTIGSIYDCLFGHITLSKLVWTTQTWLRLNFFVLYRQLVHTHMLWQILLVLTVHHMILDTLMSRMDQPNIFQWTLMACAQLKQKPFVVKTWTFKPMSTNLGTTIKTFNRISGSLKDDRTWMLKATSPRWDVVVKVVNQSWIFSLY